MPLDPQVQILLDLAKKAALPEVWQLTPYQGREQYAMRVNKLTFSDSIFRSVDRRIPGPGPDTALRPYTPPQPRPAPHPPHHPKAEDLANHIRHPAALPVDADGGHSHRPRGVWHLSPGLR